MLELMRALSGVSGVSSREEDMRALIRALALPWADEIREDPLGSLIVRKKGKNSGKSLLLSAFMDECGVMVSDFTEQGAAQQIALLHLRGADALHGGEATTNQLL